MQLSEREENVNSQRWDVTFLKIRETTLLNQQPVNHKTKFQTSLYLLSLCASSCVLHLLLAPAEP